MAGLALLLRVVAYTAGVWLWLSFSWAALPSPPRDRAQPGEYAAAVLRSGETLTRVYDVGDFFPFTKRGPSFTHTPDRSAFAVDYTFDPCARTLRIGLAPPLKVEIPSSTPHDFNQFSIDVREGDQDGINLPWFSHADATLLFWQIHRERSRIPVRVARARAETFSKLELWVDLPNWERSKPANFLPLLAIECPNAGYPGRCEATLAGSSPSYTYPIRVAILFLIIPLSLVCLAILHAAWALCALLLAVVRLLLQLLVMVGFLVVIVWLGKGRPPIRDFVADSPMTRFIFVRIRRNTDGQTLLLSGEGTASDARQLRPLRNLWDFFRSSSPLDELLVTFDATRPLVQLLAFGSIFAGAENTATDVEAQIDPQSNAAEKAGDGIQ